MVIIGWGVLQKVTVPERVYKDVTQGNLCQAETSSKLLLFWKTFKIPFSV